MKDDRVYLRHIRDAIHDIQQYATTGAHLNQVRDDRLGSLYFFFSVALVTL